MEAMEEKRAVGITKGGADAACRMSARGVLEQEFRRQEDRATALNILLKVIPWSLLSPADEEILWRYFCQR